MGLWFIHSLYNQANVYHATTANGENRAIKIYKTSILLFKDRDKYVSGEFRYEKFQFLAMNDFEATPNFGLHANNAITLS